MRHFFGGSCASARSLYCRVLLPDAYGDEQAGGRSGKKKRRRRRRRRRRRKERSRSRSRRSRQRIAHSAERVGIPVVQRLTAADLKCESTREVTTTGSYISDKRANNLEIVAK